MYDISTLYEPNSVTTACRYLKGNPKAIVMAGGSDILIKIREGKLQGSEIVSIRHLKELRGIQMLSDGAILIKPLTSFSEIAKNEIINKYIPVLAQAVLTIAGPQIRNIGTIGGNICNGVTSADSASTLLALDAELLISNGYKTRTTPISEFYISPGKVAIDRDELLTGIVISKNSYFNCHGTYIKYAQRGAMDIATLGCSANVVLNDDNTKLKRLRLAFGVAAPTPIRVRGVEMLAENKTIKDSLFATIAAAVESDVNPRTSWRASKEFRMHLIKELTKKAILNSVELAKNAPKEIAQNDIDGSDTTLNAFTITAAEQLAQAMSVELPPQEFMTTTPAQVAQIQEPEVVYQPAVAQTQTLIQIELPAELLEIVELPDIANEPPFVELEIPQIPVIEKVDFVESFAAPEILQPISLEAAADLLAPSSYEPVLQETPLPIEQDMPQTIEQTIEQGFEQLPVIELAEVQQESQIQTVVGTISVEDFEPAAVPFVEVQNEPVAPEIAPPVQEAPLLIEAQPKEPPYTTPLDTIFKDPFASFQKLQKKDIVVEPEPLKAAIFTQTSSDEISIEQQVELSMSAISLDIEQHEKATALPVITAVLPEFEETQGFTAITEQDVSKAKVIKNQRLGNVKNMFNFGRKKQEKPPEAEQGSEPETIIPVVE